MIGVNEMKRLNKFITSVLIMTIVSAFALMNTYAELQTVWNADFSGMSDLQVPAGTITEKNSDFSAEIKNGSLEVKSDSVCYFQIEDSNSLNSSANSHGITLQLRGSDPFITKRAEPITFQGVRYDYSGHGDNSVFITNEKCGKYALKQFTYINDDKYSGDSTSAADALRTNQSRFIVDTSLFSSNDNNLTIEVKYYTEDTEDNSFSLIYPLKGSKDEGKKVVFSNDNPPDAEDGKIRTAKIELSDIDLSKFLPWEKNSIRLNTAAAKENYFYSIAIYRTQTDGASAAYNTIEKKLADNVLYGDVELTYDMTLPKGERYIDGIDYNTGENVMSVSLADGGKNEFASLVYNITDDGSAIYALTSNAEENGIKEKIYEGEILGKALTYKILTDTQNGVYEVKIFEGENLLAETANPIPFNNKDIIGNKCRTQYVNLKHNSKSKAVFSEISSINVSLEENMDYKYCNEDADAIELDISSDNVVLNDFELPTVGRLHQSGIRWSSSDESAIQVVDNTAAVTRSEDGDKNVTLTAYVTQNDCEVERHFEITVRSLLGAYMEVLEPVYKTAADGTVTADLVVKNPGTAGASKISFAVFSISRSGDITDRKIDTKSDIPKYGSLTFGISGLKKGSDDSLTYYLWDENNVPIKNNVPTDISGLTVDGKVKSINLSWNQSYDDYNAIDYYEIYRDGKLIAKCNDNKYKDYTASYLENHSYSVKAVDTNAMKGIDGTGEGCTISMPYYIEPIGKTDVAINKNGKGLSMTYRDDPARAAYTEYAEVIDASGQKSLCRFIPNGRYIGLYTDKTMINRKDVAIDFTYLDTEGDLIFQYNSVIPDGKSDGIEYALKEINCGKMTNTRTWKTLSIKLDDAQFRESLLMSGSDFCLMTTNGSGFYVKKVEIVGADLYD